MNKLSKVIVRDNQGSSSFDFKSIESVRVIEGFDGATQKDSIVKVVTKSGAKHKLTFNYVAEAKRAADILAGN